MSEHLVALFNPPNAGKNLEDVMTGTCTAWNAVNSQSTIVIGGAVTVTNAPILSAALVTMGTGLVIMKQTDAGWLCLGRLTVPT